jgi:PAS domain S-box-containing protein
MTSDNSDARLAPETALEDDVADVALALLERTARRLALLQDVTAALATAVVPEDVGNTVVQRVCSALEAEAVSIRTVRPGGLAPLASKGIHASGAFSGIVIPLDARLPTTDALKGEEGVWIESGEQCDAEYPHLADVRRDQPFRACVSLPLRARGEAVGTLTLLFRDERRFDPDDRAFVLAVAEQCAQALDRAALYAEERGLRRTAERDRAVLDGLLENAPLGIGLFDRDLRFVRVNPVLAAWNGASMEAHVGRTPGELLPGLDWDTIRQEMSEVLESGVPRVEIPISLVEHGRARHFVEAWYPVLVEGEAVGLGAIIREVTAEREAKDFQKHVLGIVGHDVRSPLSAVVAAAQLLRRSTALDERQAHRVDSIVRGARRIERVVGMLLDYTRTQSGGGIPLSRVPGDLAGICRAVAQECEEANPGRAVTCGGAGDTAGEWDADRLAQVFQNLISNALDHGAPEEPVLVSCRGEPDHVEITVENVGAEIPEELLPTLFDPFERAADGPARTARGAGLGLGLFIARTIVEAHGGEIAVRCGEGRTVFTVRLPRRRQS